MSWQEVVPEFVSDVKPLETLAGEPGAVQDAERIPNFHQATRNPWSKARFFLMRDVAAVCHCERVYRQRGYLQLRYDFMRLQFSAKPIVPSQHTYSFFFCAAFLESISANPVRVSRSSRDIFSAWRKSL